MAKQKRSVWEIRFYALKQHIGFRSDALKNIIAEDVLQGNSPNSEYIHQVKLLKTISKRAKQIEEMKVSRIFLMRDI